jgi:hypothetical protein
MKYQPYPIVPKRIVNEPYLEWCKFAVEGEE